MADDALVTAFPHQLASDVRVLLAVMPEAQIAPVSPFSVYVGVKSSPFRIGSIRTSCLSQWRVR
jgi:hypothetical protein